MRKYTLTLVFASIFLACLVQNTKAQLGGQFMAPINCRGNRCPGGEVTDAPEGEENEGVIPQGVEGPAEAPKPPEAEAPAEPASEAPATTVAAEPPPAK